MTLHDFKENLPPSFLRHTSLDPPLNMTSQTSTPPSAACSVEYRDEFQHILILIYKIISIIKIVYCQFNAYNCVKLSTVFLNVPRPDTYGELAT